MFRRELADHRVADGRDEQLTNALQHITHEEPDERALAVDAGQLDAQRENEKAHRHQEQRRGKLLRYVDLPSARAQAGKERCEQRSAKHDRNGVDVLDPLRLNLHAADHQIDVVDRKQRQAAWRHLIERPEGQRAERQNQIRRHVPFFSAIRVAQREVDQYQRDRGADSFDDRPGPARPLEHEPHDGDGSEDDADPSQQAQPELPRRRLEQRRVAVHQRLPRDQREDDGNKVAERREDEKARITLGRLEIAGGGEPDEEPDIHTGVVPEEGSFAARVLRGKALRQHHVDAGNVQAAPGEEEGEADVEHRERAGRDASTADDLRCHAPDEKIPVRHEAAAEVAAEEVQAVVERAKHAHQRRGHFRRELEMLRRVEDQRRVENSEAERREDLNKEQDRRSLRRRGEKRFARLHPALLSLAVPGGVKPPGARNRGVSSLAELVKTCNSHFFKPSLCSGL